MNHRFTKATKLMMFMGAVTLVSACDQPISRGALTFYGECIGEVPADCMTVMPTGTDQSFQVNKEPIIEPHHFADAEIATTPFNNEPVIAFALTKEGTVRFAEASAARIGKVIFMLDEGHLITAPTVREAITSGRGQIVAGFTDEQAEDLVARILANRQGSSN